ncbi:hypothetical protein I6G32_04160 [Stutzerimonas stutzeri]|uniref:Uncharacterized protein n=1 Tax=Stutzerimonas balearica TaxID=74829 RepID=A0A9X7YRX1_9GAMM|nr:MULTISPECIES: hypothetical protein [Stutzerimonas stutzeri group]MCZ4127789.1 hypothetical protein [Stutzerimonas balearica]QPT30964.1 hypothetical protein I6G32_04160 [Stutzerimonas stutzeri]QQN50649.1 hypothetical protein I6H70_19315 [Stutzerimonas balearica]
MPDPRRTLADTKPYMSMPFPLHFYIRSLKLTQTAEAVFQFHWAKGYMAGNWKSQVSVEHVARLLHISAPSVKRSYATLIKLGLIRRIKTGFNADTNRPNVTITEVLIPADVAAELLSAPVRAKPQPETGYSAPAPESPQGEREDKVPIETLRSAKGHSNIGYYDYIRNQLREKLSERLSGSALDRIMGEMLWVIHKKIDSGESARKTLNMCLKRFKCNRWHTPYDMPEL